MGKLPHGIKGNHLYLKSLAVDDHLPNTAPAMFKLDLLSGDHGLAKWHRLTITTAQHRG